MFTNQNLPFSGDKKKVIQFAVALSTVLLVIWAFLLQQKNSVPQNTLSENSLAADSTRDARLDSLRLVLGSNIANASQGEEKTSGTSGVMTTFIILAISVGGLWWWTKSKDVQKLETTPVFKEVARQDLSTGQSIFVMEMNDEYWILGSSTGGLNLLHKGPKSDFPALHTASVSLNGSSKIGFNSIFTQVLGGKAS